MYSINLNKQTNKITVVYRFLDFFAKKIYWSLHEIPVFIASASRKGLGKSAHVHPGRAFAARIDEVQIKMKVQTKFRPLALLDTTACQSVTLF